MRGFDGLAFTFLPNTLGGGIFFLTGDLAGMLVFLRFRGGRLATVGGFTRLRLTGVGSSGSNGNGDGLRGESGDSGDEPGRLVLLSKLEVTSAAVLDFTGVPSNAAGGAADLGGLGGEKASEGGADELEPTTWLGRLWVEVTGDVRSASMSKMLD